MALPVNSNISSINAQRNLVNSTNQLSKSLERLSSGLRINRAGDDAAGLAISTGLRSQIRGLNQAVRNASDGLSLIGTAEGAINSYTDMLQRIRELAIQSANDTNSASNRKALDQEAQQLLEELGRLSGTVEFNGTKLLDGSFTAKQLQVGAQAHQTISITTGDLRSSQLGQVVRQEGSAVPLTNALSDTDLKINGVDITGIVSDGISYDKGDRSAIAIANAINAKTTDHSVTAEVMTTELTAANAVAGGAIDVPGGDQLVINGIDIFDSSFSSISANDADGALRDAINAKTNQTGVIATIDGNALKLTAEDGRNITVSSTGTLNDELGFTLTDTAVSEEAGGKLRLISNDDINFAGDNPGYAGFSTAIYSKDPNLAINTISIASVDGANLAIDQVDNALNQINNIRAKLGAITNRLEHTINNLQSISENLSASDSRIRDADFAYETAQLTRNQILQQAGIAILSQANTTTQSALQLLQGG